VPLEELARQDWGQIGLVTLLAGALIGTWRWIFVRLTREVDYWRDLALTNLGLADKGVEVAKDAVKHAEPTSDA
jgi:hypothetical protein